MSAENSNFDDLVAGEGQRFTEAVQQIIERRSVIEQVKGALMFAFGVNADEAFEMLVEQSQRHNVKLYVLAEQVMKDLTEIPDVDGFASRSVHRALITAYQRIQ
jgi:hypothetical protein